MLHAMSADHKIKQYLKVAATLTIITFLELTIVKAQILPPVLTTIVVVSLSLSKAFMVAWFFMHLNHERGWTRTVAILPLGMVVYAAVLMADQKWRPISDYIGEPAREHPTPMMHEEKEESKEAPKAEAAPAPVETSAPVTAQPTTDKAAPTEQKAPANPPAGGSSGGADAWK